MSPYVKKVDRLFLIISLLLITSGFFIFVSAALGILARSEAQFQSILFSQIILGLAGGGMAMYFTSRIKYQFWKKYAFWVFLFSIILTTFVFVPGIGFEHGGAKRWLDIGFTTFQPSEILKLGLVIYLAAWFSFIKRKVESPYYGLYPLLAMLGIAGALLLTQPDTGTFLIAASAGVAMFIVAGGKWQHFAILGIIGIVLVGSVAYMKPYVMDRIQTLIHPDDFHGSGYQIKQSLIAIGSGGIFGRGFGQSVQKFNYLPEPIGDSIYAVYSEETGFIGSSLLILLYLLFALRGLTIASRAPDKFGGLLATGLVILIITQSMTNIGSMLALGPLTGVPLVFVSHGGTALFIAMAEVGILLNISRFGTS
jgi:cell division protein FtsW